jgi:uncharacterized protein with von Willebrand factor type A (vWA) domain
MKFKEALKRHQFLKDRIAASRPDDVRLASEVWEGVTGVGVRGRTPTMITQAVADTAPAEYVILLARDDIAAGFATACIYDVFQSNPKPGSPHAARRLAEHGWRTFINLAKQGGHQRHGTGGDQSTSWQITKAAQEVKPDPEKVRKISLLAGRMYAALKGARAQRVQAPQEIVGIKTGDEFEELIPSEYAFLAAGDVTKMALFQALSERKAVQYEKSGRERRSRGPLVILVDESGSMRHVANAGGYERDDWAKAAMTALTRIAWEDKRPVVVVHFATFTRAAVLPPGAHGDLIRAQHTFLDGGTAIGAAIEVGVMEVETLAKGGHTGADLVLITDGGNTGSYTLEGPVDTMLKADVRLFTVAIDCEITGLLKDKASEYVHLSDKDMADPNKAGAVVGAI